MADSRLFQPVKVGRVQLRTRAAMAPLTRFRASDSNVPLQPMVSQQYAQRASFGGTLIIAEAAGISPQGTGYFNVPGLWREDQLASWRQTTDAIHAQGSSAWAQLWHMGRASGAGPAALHGVDVVSAGDIPMPDEGAVTPRPLSEAEIRAAVAEYVHAARGAVERGGFDGVEIHAAHGYLIDQFLQECSNNRTDRYGGSLENRARFALEVTRAVAEAVGAERTAIRISPWSRYQGMGGQDNTETFTYLVGELKKLGLAYLHLVEPRVSGGADKTAQQMQGHESNDALIDLWGTTSPIVLAGGFNEHNWRDRVEGRHADKDIIVAYGRFFIPTPDLVYRLNKGLPFTKYDRSNFYNPKQPKGYVDYPFSQEWLAEHPNSELARI